MTKAQNYFADLLREQGYSESAIEEICKWYIYSTTDKATGKLPLKSNN